MAVDSACSDAKLAVVNIAFWCILALAFAPLTMARTLHAQSAPGVLPTLTTARAAHQLTTKEARRGYPVSIKAVVTYYDRFIDPRRANLFVSDASGGIFVGLSAIPPVDLRAGDLIAIKGVSGSGDYAPIVEHAEARKIAQSHLPIKAPHVSMTELLAGTQDGQWVEVEGVVHAVRYSDSAKNVFLDLALRDGKLIATTVSDPQVDYKKLIDSTILLRGNVSPRFNHQGQMTGSDLVFPGVSSIKLKQGAPSDPFLAPVERVSDLLRYTPSGGLSHRVHVHGQVTLQWPGRLLCIHDGTQGLCAETAQKTPLQIGDDLDVIGFPSLGEFNPTLSHADYRRSGNNQAPAALTMTPRQVLESTPEAELITIDGQLIGMDEASEGSAIVLAVGDLTFSATLQNKSSVSRFRAMEKGSLLRLTGICSVQSDGSGRTTGSGFPIANGFRVLLRSPEDALILRKPSWWNAEHTLRVLALALLITFGILLRMMVLSNRVKQQTLEILESERRFRFLATHDGLTQLPNRRAILTFLSSTLDSAKRQGAVACIALVDLDHFKQVNDVYGHQAGDEVLRQAAARLSLSIRAGDLVGRYGGEEFLIVFQESTEELGVERCDMIRRAVCSEAIDCGPTVLSISCSIGVASTTYRGNSANSLIALADAALYRAKANGRNRVEAASQLELQTAS